jgi:hypothetical protein
MWITLSISTFLPTPTHKGGYCFANKGVDNSFYVENPVVVPKQLTFKDLMKGLTRLFHIVFHTCVENCTIASFSGIHIVYKGLIKRVTVLEKPFIATSYEVIHKFTPLMMAGKKLNIK